MSAVIGSSETDHLSSVDVGGIRMTDRQSKTRNEYNDAIVPRVLCISVLSHLLNLVPHSLKPHLTHLLALVGGIPAVPKRRSQAKAHPPQPKPHSQRREQEKTSSTLLKSRPLAVQQPVDLSQPRIHPVRAPLGHLLEHTGACGEET